MTICIYGGTFDPPHIGHMHACESFLNNFEVDKLYIIPTYMPPHKIRSSKVSAEARFDMSRIAFSSISDKIEISDVELKREGKSYTSDTIAYFKMLGNNDIYFLCGTDMFLTLDTWHEFKYIFTNAKIVCIRRESDAETEAALLKKKKEYETLYNGKIFFITDDAIELSSSEIRERIQGSSVDNLLHSGVIEYIRKNNLYGKE